MDQRAKIPVTLPRDNPTKPFWQDPPDTEISDVRSTPALPATADIVIVGSGITGASIAWHLLTDSADNTSIVMLEARQACSGATGRNGGHTKAASYRSFLDHTAALGTEAAVQIARLELDGIRTVHALAVSEAIACDANPCDTADVIYDPEQWARAQQAVAAMRAAMPPDDPAAAYRLYSRAEALAAAAAGDLPCSDDEGDTTSGPPAPLCGVVRYEAGSLSAYRFVAGVLKRCLARGLNLQTHTPATALRRAADTGLWAVETARGTIRARHIMLATNGYSAFLEPRLQGVVVPLRGQITMHEPGRASSDEDVTRQLAMTYSFIYARGYEYMITRPPGATRAGAMVIGGGLTYAGGEGSEAGVGEYGTTDDTTLNPAVSAYLHATPWRYFGRQSCWGAADAHVAAEWTGIMGYTADGYPLVGAMAGTDSENLWLCCAFQGHGMVFSWLCGRAVAAMVRGRDDDVLRRWFPDCFRVTPARLQQRFGAKPGSKL